MLIDLYDTCTDVHFYPLIYIIKCYLIDQALLKYMSSNVPTLIHKWYLVPILKPESQGDIIILF